MTIRNPLEWAAGEFGALGRAGAAAARAVHPADERPGAVPSIRRIGAADIRQALAKGFDDFAACRSDVLFLALVYPLIGLVLWSAALHNAMQPLVFPLASGFALIGPFAAIGLYEMSRRREAGVEPTWTDALGVFASPSLGAILTMGLMLLVLFLAWLVAAQGVYALTLGPEPPASLSAFAHDVVATAAGRAMIVIGIAVGFVFAAVALTVGVVSFPLLLDRKVGVGTAVWTSVRAVAANPGPMAAWGLIVAGGLVLGSLPLLVGLVVIMPVLGHATWHLYRALVGPAPAA